MFLGRTVAVVVPAYNEERLIARTIQSIPSWVDEILVIDDASDDRTPKIVQTLSRPGLFLERHPQNQGVGAAIATGYRLALAHQIDLVAVMAGDAQMDPADLSAILRPVALGEADYAKGNRLAHPDVWRVMPLSRLVGTYALSLLTRPISGYWHLLDSQCGYTAISRKALLLLDLDSLYPRYGYPNDILVQLGSHKLKMVDVPVRPVYGEETSGFHPLTVAPRLLFVLARALARRIRREVLGKYP